MINLFLWYYFTSNSEKLEHDESISHTKVEEVLILDDESVVIVKDCICVYVCVCISFA